MNFSIILIENWDSHPDIHKDNFLNYLCTYLGKM